MANTQFNYSLDLKKILLYEFNGLNMKSPWQWIRDFVYVKACEIINQAIFRADFGNAKDKIHALIAQSVSPRIDKLLVMIKL